MNATTEQVEDKPTENKNVPNPSGRGGFADHPENINAGGRPKNEESFTYWMNYFKKLTVREFLTWIKDNNEDVRSVASELAYNRVLNARLDLAEFREVADRTEGKPKQPVEHAGEVDLNIKRLEQILDELDYERNTSGEHTEDQDNS